jgi:CheY-like chemotaxis protein
LIIMTKKILLVDDSPTSRLASRMVLGKMQNYELISACDGKEGIETAIREQPDLILMDIEMPRMTGLEACKFLKQNNATKTIPIVLLTTRGEKSNVAQGYASGCSDFLLKPINEQKLTTVIRALLGEPQHSER